MVSVPATTGLCCLRLLRVTETMVFVSATVVQGAAGRKFILWLMLIIGYGMQ